MARRPQPAPPVGVAEIVERDGDGDLWVRRAGGKGAALVRLAPDRREVAGGAPGLGDRLLVRFTRLESGETEARLIKRLGQSAHQVLGVVRKSRGEARLEPVDRKSRFAVILDGREARDARDGDLALARVSGESPRPYGPKRGTLIEVVGREDDPRAASLIAIAAHGVPIGFPPQAEAEALAAEPPNPSGRADLTHLPLITIDPSDARDHDDAVFAEADPDPGNPGGWIVWVAIADVARFVRPGSALDRAARDKGVSVYFPDRVEPMLPERLSADLCSLVPGETRACLAVRMVFDAEGARLGWRFHRGLMRSAASLSYDEAQAAIDDHPDPATAPLLEKVLKPLWGAFAALEIGRAARAPLEIVSTERKIEMDPAGRVVSIVPRQTLSAHRLIEEMMIQANVCAAETLARTRTPLVWRVHEAPGADRLEALADFLASLDIPWSRGEPATTRRFDRLLASVAGGPHAEIVNEVVLRTQSQARYDADNLGHFGLNLDRYAHFTSPIRRYADVLTHRGLIGALKLGEDGLSREDAAGMAAAGERITAAERRAMAAERDAADRFVAAYLQDRVGATFAGRITGVTRFGLFVRLSETGADGLVPIAALAAAAGGDYFRHDEKAHALVGERSGATWRLGRRVEVRLAEAAPLTGGLRLEMLSEAEAGSPAALRGRLRPDRSRRAPRRRPGRR